LNSRTIKIKISYDGTAYVGWQMQPNGVSIQSSLQDAVHSMTGERVSVIASGRTDAGVHAVAQVAHFRTDSSITADGFVGGLNSYLPFDIAVVDAEEAPEDFHAMKSARGKRYVYRLLRASCRAPLAQNRYWETGMRLDVEGVKNSLPCLIGKNDYESFRAAGCACAHAVRTIHSIDVRVRPAIELGIAGEGEIIELLFEGDGFVRHMIRNIVGTLVDIGKGRLERDAMPGIVTARNREAAGICAPPHGLYLEEVFY
jgi:tRNA pseudouridine38-40 synthase